MIRRSDREYAGVLTVILHSARMIAFEITMQGRDPAARSAAIPDIVDSAGLAVRAITAVDRHLPPKERKPDDAGTGAGSAAGTRPGSRTGT